MKVTIFQWFFFAIFRTRSRWWPWCPPWRPRWNENWRCLRRHRSQQEEIFWLKWGRIFRTTKCLKQMMILPYFFWMKKKKEEYKRWVVWYVYTFRLITIHTCFSVLHAIHRMLFYGINKSCSFCRKKTFYWFSGTSTCKVSEPGREHFRHEITFSKLPPDTLKAKRPEIISTTYIGMAEAQ